MNVLTRRALLAAVVPGLLLAAAPARAVCVSTSELSACLSDASGTLPGGDGGNCLYEKTSPGAPPDWDSATNGSEPPYVWIKTKAWGEMPGHRREDGAWDNRWCFELLACPPSPVTPLTCPPEVGLGLPPIGQHS